MAHRKSLDRGTFRFSKWGSPKNAWSPQRTSVTPDFLTKPTKKGFLNKTQPFGSSEFSVSQLGPLCEQNDQAFERDFIPRARAAFFVPVLWLV